ncbi:Glyoxylate/hydroxypyruvate reductase A (plasmid) [Komagataeibacter saccharivorans]|uniref:Glyoxylate/hydroxypyruvate reductase A n=1 Tax=Komagataeibacter saccharivorans TaxID=265959 RepID=A0A347WFZ2_9PROT|nr:glyoxylate/hydroxypyruvate reductase A [Komagataeibacter saccharivorans]AXY23785.1 Glyoxylate/hydroxypyruvate reductase A [Komagataeibacter saccharivorans]
MVRLVISADGPRAAGDWYDAFRCVAPELDVRSWYEPGVDIAHADYALVWEPTSDDLRRMGHLKAIICVGAGVNHLLHDPGFPVHVPLVRMGGEQTAALMADYVLWAALGLLRDARTWTVQQQRGVWKNNPVSRTCREARIGIMGMGHLGAYVARHLHHVGFSVAGWRRTARDVPGITVFTGTDALPDFLADLDILVDLLPSTHATRGIINHALLQHLPRGAGFINVGRGNHVIMDDLLRALDEGALGAAVLDVTEPEPLPPGHPLWRHERVTITPHVASQASYEAQARYVRDVIMQMERHERPALLCDPMRGY